MTSRLQVARADRGWSQTQLIAALVSRAREEGVALPGLPSLKAMVSRWENGKARPDVLYARLLRQVYGLGDVDLGLRLDATSPSVETANDELVRMLDAAKGTPAEVVLMLQQQTDSLRVLDRSLGAPRLLEQMRGHVTMLSSLVRDSVCATQRRPIAAVLADAAALAGWQALDVGGAAQAWQHFETAKAAAREAGDPGLLAHATAEQAYVLMDLGRPEDAVSLVAEARRISRRSMPPLTACWLSAVEGEAHAQLGDEVHALRAFDAAQGLLASEPADGIPYLVVDERHLLRWRGNVLAQLGHREALDCLTQALGRMDGDFRRAAASLHCDLAAVHTASGDLDAAAAHAATCRSLARQVGSVRQMKRLGRLHRAA